MSRLSDDTILTREVIDALDLGGRAHNVLMNNFEGRSVADLRGAMADRRRPILHCGAATSAEIMAALDGELRPISHEALERQVARIQAEASARIARLRARTARHLNMEWRP